MVGLGALFSLIFHLGTKEKPSPWGSLHQLDESSPLLPKECPGAPRPLLLWRDWLLEPAFYQVRPRAVCGTGPGLPPCLGAVGILWQWDVPQVQVRMG